MRVLVWNEREQRLRAFPRICLFLVTYTIIFISIPVLVALSAGGLMRSAILRALLVLSTVGLILAAAKYLDRRPVREFGIRIDRRWMSDAIVGVIIGGAIPTGTVLMSYFGGWVTVSDTEFNITTNYLREIGLAITITVSIAVVEELVFRGYILTNAIEGFDIRWLSQPGIIAAAWGASAILFAMVHPAPSLLQGLHFLGAGLLLGFAYLLSGQIGLSIGIHTGFNFVSTYVFPTTLEPSVSVFTLVVGGPTWFIGQSGLLQTALLIPAAFAVIGYVWWQSGSIKIRPEEFY